MIAEEVILCRRAGADVPKNRWIVSLSNGETIFEDCIRNIPPAWERLGKYIKSNGLAITKMRVQLGHLEVDLPPHKSGYVQKKKMSSTGAWTKKEFCVGHVESGRALIHYVASDGSSRSAIEDDPGEPWTIYDCRPNER